MTHFLDQLRPLVETRVTFISSAALKMPTKNPAPFHRIFSTKKPTIIAEIKLAHPSKGRIYYGPLSPLQIAERYLKNGAAALSILTEPFYFQGDISLIAHVREHHPESVILLKDFILDEAQILQAKSVGANAILLIAAFLTPERLKELYEFTHSIGLTALIEVHDRAELLTALDLNPSLIGINNRNLQGLTTDLQTSIDLIAEIPEGITVISESGIQRGAEIKQLSALGFDGFLIGSSLMREDDPGIALQRLLGETQ